jgi:hypothetical protein
LGCSSSLALARLAKSTIELKRGNIRNSRQSCHGNAFPSAKHAIDILQSVAILPDCLKANFTCLVYDMLKIQTVLLDSCQAGFWGFDSDQASLLCLILCVAKILGSVRKKLCISEAA